MLLENFKRKRRTFHLLHTSNEDSVFLGETKRRKWVTGSRYLEGTLFGRHKSSVSHSHRLKWRQYVSSKCRYPPTSWHHFVFQENSILCYTTVRTSNRK